MPESLILAIPLDDLSVLLIFGVMLSIVQSDIGITTIPIWLNLLENFYKIATGIGIGILLGLSSAVLTLVDRFTEKLDILKDIWIMLQPIVILFPAYYTNFTIGTYLCSFIFGYLSSLVW